jgi:hypothetical protein
VACDRTLPLLKFQDVLNVCSEGCLEARAHYPLSSFSTHHELFTKFQSTQNEALAPPPQNESPFLRFSRYPLMIAVTGRKPRGGFLGTSKRCPLFLSHPLLHAKRKSVLCCGNLLGVACIWRCQLAYQFYSGRENADTPYHI